MKTFFYPRLAWDGIRKNRQLSRPYLLTCICMVAVFYILSFLSSPAALALVPRGANTVGLIMHLGRYVILLFSLKLDWLPAYGIDSWKCYIMPILACLPRS